MASCCSCLAGLAPRAHGARSASQFEPATGGLDPASPTPRRWNEPTGLDAKVGFALEAAEPKVIPSRVEVLVSFEVRLLSGALVAALRLPASTLVGAVIAQVNGDPMLSATLLHKGEVLARRDSLEKAGVQAGATLLLVLKKSLWQTALHGTNVKMEGLCASRGISYSNAVVLSPERSRSLAVRLLHNAGTWSGALEMGFVSEDVRNAALSNKFPTDLFHGLCRMGNGGSISSISFQGEQDHDPRETGNWTSELVPGDVIRCSLDDKDDGAQQRFSIHVNDELRLDRVFPTLAQDDAYYPAVNLYGRTTKIEFVD